jgi:ABC-type multidrug transport system fused ATPase/permease subunit
VFECFGVLELKSLMLFHRMRELLFRCILSQEIAFFDAERTGELTSRLSADTTKVGDAVGMNVNIFLRTVVSCLFPQDIRVTWVNSNYYASILLHTILSLACLTVQVQMIGLLAFMSALSWRLTLVTFTVVPAVIVIRYHPRIHAANLHAATITASTSARWAA